MGNFSCHGIFIYNNITFFLLSLFPSNDSRFANGDIYNGEWKDGFRHDKRIIICASGEQFACIYENDKLVTKEEVNYSKLGQKQESINNATSNNESDVFGKLVNLAELRNKNNITEEEFVAKKLKLLDMV